LSRRGQVWFPRFGDIPGVEWTTPAGLDRTQLPGHDAVPGFNEWDGRKFAWWPVVYRHEDDGEEVEDGTTSASPASQYPRAEKPGSMAEELRWLAEALELPGEPSTYHFIIAGAASNLFSIRLREPAALREAERLCWLDLDLVRAFPNVIRPDDRDDTTYRLAVTDLLYRLYMNSGDLRGAERVAAMAVDDFGQSSERQLAEVRGRLEALEAEDA
jgi:hypothetical protein